jgi:GTP cyclohydrolase II
MAHAMAGTLLHAGTRVIATRHGDFTLHACQDLTRRTYLLVLALGEVTTPAPLLARVHSSCVTSETYGGCDCDCSEQLDAALAAIAAAGRGIVFYLDQEGRGAGFVAKVRDRMLVQASHGRLSTFDAYAQMGLADDLRSYEAVAAARELLGIGAPLELLTNNPEKLSRLAALGVLLAGSVGLSLPPSPFNRHYLAAKAEAGHRLTMVADGVEAEPPEPVEVIEPQALVGASNLVRIGAYWLPVRSRDGGTPAPHWLRLHAYADLASGRERVVLTYGDPTATPALLRLQHEALLERVPGRERGIEKRRWSATVGAFVEHGAGVAVMIADESCAAILDSFRPRPLGRFAPNAPIGEREPASARSQASVCSTLDVADSTDAAAGNLGPRGELGDLESFRPRPLGEDEPATLALVVHHLAGRVVIPLRDGPTPTAVDRARARAFAAAGLTLAAPRSLIAD